MPPIFFKSNDSLQFSVFTCDLFQEGLSLSPSNVSKSILYPSRGIVFCVYMYYACIFIHGMYSYQTHEYTPTWQKLNPTFLKKPIVLVTKYVIDTKN